MKFGYLNLEYASKHSRCRVTSRVRELSETEDQRAVLSRLLAVSLPDTLLGYIR